MIEEREKSVEPTIFVISFGTIFVSTCEARMFYYYGDCSTLKIQ